MTIRLYNTLARERQVFEPIEPGKVRLYNCGPTVYNFVHIGNLRAYVFVDLLRRHLEFRGFEVTHITNITDVEDKLIRLCREQGVDLKTITDKYTDAFLEDVDTLGIKRSHDYPRATDHIDDMIVLIEALKERGLAYEVEGNTYFRISAFEEYGKLSKKDLDALQSNASGRIEADEYETEDARDFALWKAYTPDDGDVYWDTPIGKGRPGWHIECSCMSMKKLGETFDIHCGGVDLIFPHHENEIAQSEGATGKPFVNYWLHNEHLIVDGKKMAKSAGNFYTLRDILDKGYNPMAVRWVLLMTHYRQRLNFTFDGLDAATESLERIRDFRERLADVQGGAAVLDEDIAACEKGFGDALDDDLNISAAMAAVFEFIRETNRKIDAGEIGIADAQAALAMFDRLDDVVGLLNPGGEGVPEAVMEKVMARQQARRDKDFAKSDAIRDELLAEGWVIKDTPDGPRVHRRLEQNA